MPSYAKQARPTISYTKQTRNPGAKAGRFGIGTFGSARFGITDSYTKQPSPSTTHTKQPRP